MNLLPCLRKTCLKFLLDLPHKSSLLVETVLVELKTKIKELVNQIYCLKVPETTSKMLFSIKIDKTRSMQVSLLFHNIAHWYFSPEALRILIEQDLRKCYCYYAIQRNQKLNFYHFF